MVQLAVVAVWNAVTLRAKFAWLSRETRITETGAMFAASSVVDLCERIVTPCLDEIVTLTTRRSAVDIPVPASSVYIFIVSCDRPPRAITGFTRRLYFRIVSIRKLLTNLL